MHPYNGRCTIREVENYNTDKDDEQGWKTHINERIRKEMTTINIV